MPSTRALIHAPWSASKVSTALRCPRLFHFKYIEKIKEPEVMAEARIGKSIHKALELVLQGTPENEAALVTGCSDGVARTSRKNSPTRSSSWRRTKVHPGGRRCPAT